MHIPNTPRLVRTLACLSVLVCLPMAAWAGLVDPDDVDQAPLLRAVESLHSGDATTARSLLTRYMQEFPEDPLGPLLRLKVSWWAILEGRDPEDRLTESIQQDFERVRAVCDERLHEDEDDVRALYAMGEAWCAMGRLEGLQGHGWSTLRHHQRGTPYLSRALELDPSLPEPRVSLGVFHYYASRAPGFLRFLARFFRVRSDRPLGLEYLREAAETPGIQQAEAAFFLLEVLTNVEDEHLEALPLALRFHQRYPDNLGFRIPLSAAQIAWGRPDAALQTLRDGATRRDDHDAIAARFFEARMLGLTGRARESASILESFTPADVRSISWLPAWHPYYLGSAYEQLGRPEDAEVAFRRTVEARKVADSHGFAERALERSHSALDRAVSGALQAMNWRDSVDVAANRLRVALEHPQQADPERRTEALYLLGCLEIERGEYEAAVAALRAAIDGEQGEDAWLVIRPRIRFLQALLWSGRLDEARDVARSLAETQGEWGSNRHLQLVIQTALQPADDMVVFQPEMKRASGQVSRWFRLRDVGLTSVQLAWDTGHGIQRIPMRLRGGFWEVQVRMAAGTQRYGFVLESGAWLPDPACPDVQDWRGALWSVRRLPTPDS
jgi:tetratricopeptide (TPR) repeat protein